MICQKIKAFTIMELIVTLTISSLVIFSGIEFLSSWEKLISRRNTSLEVCGGVLKIYDVLSRDITDSDNVLSDDDRIRITNQSNEVRYFFGERSIIRLVKEVRDTFNFSKVTINIEKDFLTGYVKMLTIEINTENDFYPLTIEKNYPSDLIVNALVFR